MEQKPDFKIARDMALLSNLAYDIFDDDKENPFGSYRVGNFAFILRDKGTYMELAFQGTNDIRDMLSDCNADFNVPTEVDRTWPQVHVGFWKAFWACNVLLFPRLPTSKPLRVTGHSLGAAMAKLAVRYLSDRGHKIECLYTFGCPHVGGVPWVNFYTLKEIPTFDFIHGRDGIPFLPPWGLPTGESLFLDLRGRLVDNRIGVGFNPIRWVNAWVQDHAIDAYLVCMDKLCG